MQQFASKLFYVESLYNTSAAIYIDWVFKLFGQSAEGRRTTYRSNVVFGFPYLLLKTSIRLTCPS